jgi:hypothetical protein
MSTLTIDLINPKAKELLQNLADLNIIAIKPKSKNSFGTLLKKMRAQSTEAPTFEEISKEVEKVRKARYAK